MSLVLILLLALAVVAVIVGAPRWRRLRREAWAARPFPAAWRAILRHRVPLYRRLPVPLQAQLRRRIQVFLAEKQIVGCGGLRVTDEMRVTVAAHAALLQLNREEPHYPDLHRVLLYPGAFIVERVQADGGGVLREERRVLAGESWSRGQVILSWPDVLQGARLADDGHNVALHEFAHQLDQASGPANGAPRQDTSALQARWAQILQAEYDALRDRLARRERRGWGDDAEPELIDAYGATAPAEFFAVVTEVFFERPLALAGRHPRLFEVLRDFYRVDPRAWSA